MTAIDYAVRAGIPPENAEAYVQGLVDWANRGYKNLNTWNHAKHYGKKDLRYSYKIWKDSLIIVNLARQ